jgi:carboxyl-terminal processing protease
MPSEKDTATDNKTIDESSEISVKTDETSEYPDHTSGNKKNSLFGFIVQFFLIAVLFFAIGFAVGQKIENQNVDFSLFWEVFNILPKRYIDKSAVNGQEMLYGAISGMVRSLGDPYTAFVDPDQNELIKSDLAGSYEGVGIQIGFNEDKRLAVIAPLTETPAEKSGVLAKDVITKIDDKDTFDITLPEAVELIRGTAGTSVILTLIREDETEPLEIEITRSKIDIKSVEVEYRNIEGRDIAIVKVIRFGEKTDLEWDAIIDEIVNRDTDAVVIDMRNNPGGLLSSAIHLAGEFIRGTVVKQETADGKVNSLPTDGGARLLKLKIAVLVNGGSASAAEIFAGAIQDTGRGEIIGEQSFGKGTVQDVVDLPGGSSLHVTIARWLTPDGNSIQDVGITPDIFIKETKEDRESDRDPQLEKALEIL